MTTFTYTKVFEESDDYNSEWVESIFQNENDNSLVVNINDTYYKYDNVTPEVVSRFVNADSVGEYYNVAIKNTYGPGEKLGDWWEVTSVWEPVEKSGPGVPKDLVANPDKERYGDGQPMFVGDSVDAGVITNATKEFSLQSPVLLDDLEVPTKEYSLATPAAPVSVVAREGVSSTVEFTLDDYDKVYSFAGAHDNVESAIDEVNEYVKRLGAKGVVRKVVFEFE